MKKTIVILCLSLFAFNAQAGFWDVIGAIGGAIGDSGSRDSSRPARLSCTYQDRGYEEHSRGHKNCRECLEKHGRCVESCSVEYVVCKIEGRDYRGYTMVVEGKANTQYEAERDALRRCDRNGWTECRRTSCNNQSESVSRKECR